MDSEKVRLWGKTGSDRRTVKPTRVTRFGHPIQTPAPEHAHNLLWRCVPRYNLELQGGNLPLLC
jgi:hypothetical protein